MLVCYVCWWYVSNIVIGMYVLDMWSVLFVPYVAVGSNIAIIIRTVRTGHVVTVVYSVSWWWILVIGLYVP